MDDAMYISKKTNTRTSVSQNDVEQMSVTKIRKISTCHSKHYRDINAGWGRCRYTWCGCRGFKGNTNYACQNCGHKYSDHF